MDYRQMGTADDKVILMRHIDWLMPQKYTFQGDARFLNMNKVLLF